MWNCMTSIFEFSRPLEDLVLFDYMASRYPWRSKRITRAKHLEFIWFQFLNLCYLFKEKYRVCWNRHNRLMQALGRAHREDVAAGLKEIDTALGAFIRSRGQHTHEFGVYHQRITTLSTIEFVREHRDVVVKLDDEGRSYRIARGLVREDIERARQFMVEFLGKAARGFLKEYSAAVTNFNKLIDKGLTQEKTRASNRRGAV
jgi:hypothetical protein